MSAIEEYGRRRGVRSCREDDDDDDDDDDETAAVSSLRGGASTSRKTERNEVAKWRLIVRNLPTTNGLSSLPTIRDKHDINIACDVLRAIKDDSIFDALLHNLSRCNYARGYVVSIWKTLCRVNSSARRQMKILLSSVANTTNGGTVEGHVIRCRRTRRASFEEDDSGGAVAGAPPIAAVSVECGSSVKSDGRLTFTENEFDSMFATVDDALSRLSACNSGDDSDYDNSFHSDRAIFLYSFYMLVVTGKRLSDIAELNVARLVELHERGVCAMRVRKTGKLGRIEIPELLRPSANDSVSSKKPNPEDRFRANYIRERLRFFVRKARDGCLEIPFDRNRRRKALDATLRRLYAVVCGRAKPRGLSFHALRRGYAAYRFLQGVSIERLRENLDHSSRRQTNAYVNLGLYGLSRRLDH